MTDAILKDKILSHAQHVLRAGHIAQPKKLPSKH